MWRASLALPQQCVLSIAVRSMHVLSCNCCVDVAIALTTLESVQLVSCKAGQQSRSATVQSLRQLVEFDGAKLDCADGSNWLRRGLDSVQATFSQLNALKDQMEGAQSALRKVETSSSKPADGLTNNKT
jgi:hypothetical protein